MKHLQRILDLQEFFLRFNQLERTLLLPSIPGKPDRNETDTEHSYSLAMMAWYLSQGIDHLDSNKCVRYAMVHDIVELYAGDTFAYDKNQHVHQTVSRREQQGIAQLTEDWSDFPDLLSAINTYETRTDAESRFVYALDKIMPMVVNALSEGKNYRRHGVQLADVKRVKAAKVAESPEVKEIYEELISLFESKPAYFNDSLPVAVEDAEKYLRQAVELSERSEEPIKCGAVIVSSAGETLAATYNSQRSDNIAVYHAEIKAIIEANKKTQSRTLNGATIYCSCEPCTMCLAAISSAKIAKVVFHKRMIDLCPDDPQAQFDPYAYVQGLNFVPQLQQMKLS